MAAHQIAAREGVSIKANEIAVFDNPNVQKQHFDIDGARYPKDSVNIDYESNDYVDHHRDFKIFHKEYVEEGIINFLISYTDMNNKSSVQVIDLRFQVDHINPKNN